ncbi:MAG: class I SAM-dependent methyltransferase [Anaerolineaceae bacterium]
MKPYQHFARHYHTGPYIQFTNWVYKDVFPHILETLQFAPASLLDLACGSGVFAIHMAKQGLTVTGLDASADMLEIARSSAKEQAAPVQWLHQDMSKLDLPVQFDCVTSFFDSLNYLLKVSELSDTFKAAFRQLNPGGYFIFDMNTIYGLAVSWQRSPHFIPQDLPDYLEVAENSYDYENGIAQMRIIMFERDGKYWVRHEELHKERGYAMEDIMLLLQQAGFEIRLLVGNPMQMTPLSGKDDRLWIAAQKPR